MKVLRSCSGVKTSGFTLLEIAVSLAVIGFAIVAVIGVLPTGLNIQRDTRERTVVLQDATYFLEALRQGPRGTNDLIGNVEQIWVAYYQGENVAPRVEQLQRYKDYKTDAEVVELLTLPRAGRYGDHLYSVALVRSLSGSASEKGGVSSEDGRIAFSYFVRTEVVPITSVQQRAFTTTEKLDPREDMHRKTQSRRFFNSLNEIKVTMMWPPSPPVYTHGWVPRNEVTLRTYISGSLTNSQQRILHSGRFL